MKCATSTLHEQLARQPGVFMSEPKEPNFFSNDEVYARGTAWYRDLFARGSDAMLRGESSTHYTKLPTYPRTIDRMCALLPQLKLVYLMRHPVDRLVSHYVHEWSMRVITSPIDLAVQRHSELCDYGCYRRQLAPFFETYGRENVLPVFLERLQRSPQPELERVCKFLGYQGQPIWQADMAQRNISSERLRLGRLGRQIMDDPVVTALRRRLVPQAVRDMLKARLSMNERPELSPSTRAHVEQVFDRDLGALGRELGTTLSCATWKTRVSEGPLEWA